MAYPPAPWNLKGYAVQAIRLVRVDRARPLVPAPLKIVSVLPGKTLGIIYFAAYGPGSSLQYHELIIAAALIQLGKDFGFWISHIYVDNLDSQAGGRESWGLPKEMAQFTWQVGGGSFVEVRQGERRLASLRSCSPGSGLRLYGFLPVISAREGNLLAYKGVVSGRFGLARTEIEIPEESPFFQLGLGGPAQTMHIGEMNFNAGAPHPLGRVLDQN